MRRIGVVLAVLFCMLPLCLEAKDLAIKPTTTLKAETSNNTSTASSFATQSNGNLGPSNISKVDIHELLYPGADTEVYAHLMLWFGPSNHMNVGYTSNDKAQIKKQIEDMISRGINGVIIDWYGPGNSIDDATKLVMAEAEAHQGFSFAIMVDKGAIDKYSCGDCSAQESLIEQLEYVEQTYFPSAAYLKRDGEPVVTNFDLDLHYKIDWKAVNTALADKPTYFFQNTSGFTHTLSGGSYSWVMPTTKDYGMSYLADFYSTGWSFPKKDTYGATYKGFNDTLAGWGANRTMGQQCGQTWLSTFSKINSMFDPSKPLPSLQLVTWNDYEEGTEIESGIDNCVTISASTSKNSLKWSISGKESTLDHYTVYISKDGQNLMSLGDFDAGNRSTDLCSFSLAQGSYTLFVKAVGKPGLKNQMSGAVKYSPSCGSSGGKVALTASPASLVIATGGSGTTSISVSPQSGEFNNPITLSCSGLPEGTVCQFEPAEVTPGGKTVWSVLTISGVNSKVSRVDKRARGLGYGAYLLVFGVIGMGWPGRRRLRQGLAIAGLAIVLVLLSSCGSGGMQPGPSASVTIDGNYNGIQGSTTMTVTIR